MSYVKPWKGKDYEAKRLLVLGESAYNKNAHPDPVIPDDSINGVIRALKGEGEAERWHLHFERIFLTVDGLVAKAAWNAEGAESFFHEIAYTNYIQGLIGPTSSYRPTPKQWRDARMPFRALLDDLKPAKVLILGFGVWRDIIKDWQIPEPEHEIFSFPIKDAANAKICVIPHPSSWNRLHPRCAPAEAHEHFCKKFGSQAAG